MLLYIFSCWSFKLERQGIGIIGIYWHSRRDMTSSLIIPWYDMVLKTRLSIHIFPMKMLMWHEKMILWLSNEYEWNFLVNYTLIFKILQLDSWDATSRVVTWVCLILWNSLSFVFTGLSLNCFRLFKLQRKGMTWFHLIYGYVFWRFCTFDLLYCVALIW